MWCVLGSSFESLCTHTAPLRAALEQGSVPTACLLSCTYFCSIPDKVWTPQSWIPACQSPLANCSVPRLWSLNNHKQWALMASWAAVWPDFTMVPRCGSHSQPPAFISTMDHGLGCWVSNPLIQDLREQLKACLRHDIVTQLSLSQRRLFKKTLMSPNTTRAVDKIPTKETTILLANFRARHTYWKKGLCLKDKNAIRQDRKETRGGIKRHKDDL